MASAVDNRVMASSDRPIDIDDDASIDEEQLEEYREMVEQLGNFPDKVKINSLSMVAEDHAESRGSAKAIYETIRRRLLNTSHDNMLPLVYVLDSILKNAKGSFVDIVEEDAANWIPTVYRKLQEPQRQKLERVWKTWDEFKIFSEDSWKAMGRCFDEKTSGNAIGSSTAQVAGITRTKDGTLLLPKPLRQEMQNVLDDMQSGVDNELDKVSLERLADLNPDLLATVKKTAEDSMRSGTPQQQQDDSSSSDLLPFFTETRSQETLDRSKAWSELKWNYREDAHDVVTKLQHRVIEDGSSGGTLYTQQEAVAMTQYLASASATAALLTASLERIQNQEDRKGNKRNVSFPGAEGAVGSGSAVSSRGVDVDANLFTNDGIKKKNSAVIGILYEIGLPFVSSADGRRFRTQLELSNHLDALFKKNQLEKSMARTEERGWYVAGPVWAGESKEEELKASAEVAEATGTAAAESDEFDPDKSTMPADESRDRCVICGINFKMFFDNDDGMYKYSNCREIEVLNDEVALNDSEQMLVHVTCWRGLGSPEVLTMDQALQETLPHY